MREHLGIDADAGVAHVEAHDEAVAVAGLEARPHLDLARLGELDRVREQVGEHLAQPPAIAAHRGGDVLVDPGEQLEAAVVRLRGEHLADVLDGRAQVEVVHVELELAGLDLREVQDVVDHPEQRLAGARGGLGLLALVVAELGLQQQLEHPDHAVERRADLVAHVGQELGLGARGLHRLAERALAIGDVGAHHGDAVVGPVAIGERELRHVVDRAVVGLLVLDDAAVAHDLDVARADGLGDLRREDVGVRGADHLGRGATAHALPAGVHEQVATLAVLDRDGRGRVAQDALEPVARGLDLALAPAQRLGHLVERLAQPLDLARAGLPDADAALAPGEPVGGLGDAPDRRDHGAAQIPAQRRSASGPRGSCRRRRWRSRSRRAARRRRCGG